VTRDGTLTEPNYGAVEELVGQTSVAVIAAGGIASVGHLVKLAELGVEGAVVGRALYTGNIDLAEAIASTKS
jgi:phosphoribosylformimino-5-aminoimidazole carboxamide ribotide isomerase